MPLEFYLYIRFELFFRILWGFEILSSWSLCDTAWLCICEEGIRHKKRYSFNHAWSFSSVRHYWPHYTSTPITSQIRRLLNISYTEHITNVEVRNRIERAIGPYEDLLTTVKRRKLKWYGHVSRSSGLSKTIMQGTVKGGRRRGGQRKRWEDNIKDWTCLRAAESLRVSKDRNGWREVVRRSVMAPLRPPEVMG